MQLCTASETISFIKELEEQLAVMCEAIGDQFGQDTESWKRFAKENRKYAKQIQMAYQSVITDAIEGCYAFDLESEDWTQDTALPSGGGYSEAVAKMVAAEEKIIALYKEGAEQSASLLADVPRNFKIIVRKRSQRLEQIRALG